MSDTEKTASEKKKKEKQIVEIHIYIHQFAPLAPQQTNPLNPPYFVTCDTIKTDL